MNYHYTSLTLHNLINKEFELFKTQYDQNTISSEQDIRGIGIVWCLCIGSDYLDYSNLRPLVSFTEKKLDENNYHSEHWYKIPSLLGASYLITKEDKFLEELYYLIDCKQASVM